MNRLFRSLLTTVLLVGISSSGQATSSNPAGEGGGQPVGSGDNVEEVTSYQVVGDWRAAAGATTLISFDASHAGEGIDAQFSEACITLVDGGSDMGPTEQYVTASTDLPFPMFVAGLLPSEPHFLSNGLNAPIYATGFISFDLAGPTTAIGAYLAESAPLDGFQIELYDDAALVGTATFPGQELPDAFVGAVSSVSFNRAVFRAVRSNDSWGLDDLEHNCRAETPTESSTWGGIKGEYR